MDLIRAYIPYQPLSSELRGFTIRATTRWVVMSFMARLELEGSGSFGKYMPYRHAAFFWGRERRGDYFDAQVKSGISWPQVNVHIAQWNRRAPFLCWRGRIFALGGKKAPHAYHNTWCADSVCFNASRLQHKCSWCSEIVVVQHNAQWIALEHILSSIWCLLVVAVQAGI